MQRLAQGKVFGKPSTAKSRPNIFDNPELYGYKKKNFSVTNDGGNLGTRLFTRPFFEGVHPSEVYISGSFSNLWGADIYNPTSPCGGNSTTLISGDNGFGDLYACDLNYTNGGSYPIVGFLGLYVWEYTIRFYDNNRVEWIFSGFILIPT
jgi:hypothetical protein